LLTRSSKEHQECTQYVQKNSVVSEEWGFHTGTTKKKDEKKGQYSPCFA
jgi:hypothetical protein